MSRDQGEDTRKCTHVATQEHWTSEQAFKSSPLNINHDVTLHGSLWSSVNGFKMLLTHACTLLCVLNVIDNTPSTTLSLQSNQLSIYVVMHLFTPFPGLVYLADFLMSRFFGSVEIVVMRKCRVGFILGLFFVVVFLSEWNNLLDLFELCLMRQTRKHKINFFNLCVFAWRKDTGNYPWSVI